MIPNMDASYVDDLCFLLWYNLLVAHGFSKREPSTRTEHPFRGIFFVGCFAVVLTYLAQSAQLQVRRGLQISVKFSRIADTNQQFC